MLVRGRVVASGEGMVFEHSGGRVVLDQAGQRETGWKTWRVEQGPGGIVLRAMPKEVQATSSSQDPAMTLQRMLALLASGRRMQRGERAGGTYQGASLAETVLLAAHPEAAQSIRELSSTIRNSRGPLDFGKALHALADVPEHEEEGEGNPFPIRNHGDASLLVCHKVFPDNENAPFLLVRTGESEDEVMWIFTGLEMSKIGPVFIGLRKDRNRISADLWCKEEYTGTVREELIARCPWPVKIRNSQEVPEVLDWSFTCILESLPGGIDARA